MSATINATAFEAMLNGGIKNIATKMAIINGANADIDVKDIGTSMFASATTNELGTFINLDNQVVFGGIESGKEIAKIELRDNSDNALVTWELSTPDEFSLPGDYAVTQFRINIDVEA